MILASLGCACSPQLQHWSGQGKMHQFQMQPGESLKITGKDCSLRIIGDFHSLYLNGNDNFITLQGKTTELLINGKGNTVECLNTTTRIQLKGEGNRMRLRQQAGQKRPQVYIEGKDQGITYQAENP